ncbi:MAG TPA: vWA domain-containing protein, partial [Planctomycetota bacterium]|nr:vWA domain-containing protein [Planctomycetota bacterium]
MKHFILLLLCCTIVCFFSILYEISWKYQIEKSIGYVFCIDRSWSISHDEIEKIQQQIQQVLPKKGKVFFVYFGKDIMSYEQQLNEHIQIPPLSFSDKICGSESNWKEALQYSIELLVQSDVEVRRIALFSDGSSFTWSKQIETLLQQHQIELYTYCVEPRNDVQLLSVDMNETAPVGSELHFRLWYSSEMQTNMTVHIQQNNKKIWQQQYEFLWGENKYIDISAGICEKGEQYFEISLTGDKRTENNKAYCFCKGIQPKILLVSDIDLPFFQQIFEKSNMILQQQTWHDTINPSLYSSLLLYQPVNTANIQQHELQIEQYLQSGGVIFCLDFPPMNVPWLPIEFQQETKETEQEKTWDFTLPDKKENNKTIDLEMKSACVLFVLDKSGSMQGEKIELAKQAITEALLKLWKQDIAGVLAFNETQNWIVPLGRGVDIQWAIDLVQNIQPEGSTKIFEALQRAHKSMKNISTHIKHIIFISDGYDDSGILIQKAMKKIVQKISQDKITITTIGVGEAFDATLLREMAENSKGHFFQATQYSALPVLLLKDVDRILKIRENNKPLQKNKEKHTISPKNKQKTDKKYNIFSQYPTSLVQPWSSFPVSLISYPSKIKQNTIIHLQSTERQLLTEIEYSKGNVLLWNAPIQEWQQWNEYSHFWSHIIQQTIHWPTQDI